MNSAVLDAVGFIRPGALIRTSGSPWLALPIVPGSGHAEPDVRMISSMATRELLASLARRFMDRPRWQVQAEAAGGVDVARRVQAGEPFDLVVLAEAAIDTLIAHGYLRADTRTPLVDSGMGIAVRAGTALPDISDSTALARCLLQAETIGYSTGPSGNHLLALVKRLGIEAQVTPKLRQAPAGVPVGSFLARGEVAIGFQQISELLNIEGIELVGPLPADTQLMTTFVAAVSGRARNPQAARALLDYLTASEHHELIRSLGMEPALRAC